MISTYDQLTAAFARAQVKPIMKFAGGAAEGAGEWFSYWLLGGSPGTGATPSPGLNGQQVTNTMDGTIKITDAVGNQNYLAGFELAGTLLSSVMLYDRLWQNSGIAATTTTAQAIAAPVALPTRDENGSANGENVLPWLECYSAVGNASPVTGATISYTNSDGVAGRTGTLATIPATPAQGTLIPISLQAGDAGVRSIQSITLGTSLVSGSVGLILVRPLATLSISAANSADSRNFFDIARKLYSGSALALAALCSQTAAPVLSGKVVVVSG